MSGSARQTPRDQQPPDSGEGTGVAVPQHFVGAWPEGQPQNLSGIKMPDQIKILVLAATGRLVREKTSFSCKEAACPLPG